MSKLEGFLAYADSYRRALTAVAMAMIVFIAWLDWRYLDISLGFLYLVPILLTAPASGAGQITAMAIVSSWLTESFDPSQGASGKTGWELVALLNPLHWAAGSIERLLIVATGFAMTGFFVSELNRRRVYLLARMAERESEMQYRREAEERVRVLIETSPLAILTLNETGKVELANESARELLGFDESPLQGQAVAPYLPILPRMLRSYHGATHLRTTVETKGQRKNGELFLAHVWLSTYQVAAGPGLAAVIWDASENLRDREGAGLDSMMATSRVLVGALSHEIRNLAAAAASAHGALSNEAPVQNSGSYQALGTLILGLERIAHAGLQMTRGKALAVADLETVLDETRIVIAPGMREAGIQLEWEAQDNLPLVQGDHHSLLQVFLNLSRNAEQALSGRAHAKLRVSAAIERDLVVVRFSDNGPGVQHPDQLFQPFQPGASKTGLGLYVSRAMVRSHGGGLRYEAQDAGSSFAVELWPVENISGEHDTGNRNHSSAAR